MNKKPEVDAINTLKMDIGQSDYVFLGPEWEHKDVCDPFSRLYFIRNGHGFLKTEEETVTLTGGYVYLVPAGCKFSYGCDNLEKLYFHVSITTVEKYDLLSDVGKIYVLPFCEDEFNELLTCYLSGDYMGLLKLKMLLHKTILAFAETYGFEKPPVKQYSELVERVISYIQRNTKISLSVAMISKHFFVSESKIRNAFKEEMGIPIGKYIDDLVFFKARQLLAKKISIGEISQQLGFCDQFYFSRRFKEKYNQSPAEFRKEILIL